MRHSKVLGRDKNKNYNKKHKKKYDSIECVQELLADILDVLVSLYMICIMVIMPFYFTDGYARIGTNKYEFLYETSKIGGLIVLPFVCLYMVLWGYDCFRKRADLRQVLRKAFSVTDWFVLGYCLVTVLSYWCSQYREGSDMGDAFQGAKGWYMGLASQLIFVAVYFGVSRFWGRHKWMPALWIPVTVGVFGLGYLNRFDVRPLEMKNTTPEFISTIGNMNWYCGYIVVLFSAILYYIWASEKKSRWWCLLAGMWLTLGFATLLTQGSQSGILALGAVLILLYVYSMKSGERLQTFWGCLVCMGLACGITCLLRSMFMEHYNYEDRLSRLFTYSPLAIAILAIAIIMYAATTFLQKRKRVPVKVFSVLGYVGCGGVILAAIAFLILGIVNTKYPGSIGALSGISLLTFDYEWGSLRGVTWAAGVICFREQDWLHKLLGVGPDCLVNYIYSGENAELLLLVIEYFNSRSLTNTHCEWLTALVNTGVLGMVTYAGIMISAMVRFLRSRRMLPIVGACGFGVLAYTVNNMVSFQQSMSTVTVFLLLGMGEAYLRKRG